MRRRADHADRRRPDIEVDPFLTIDNRELFYTRQSGGKKQIWRARRDGQNISDLGIGPFVAASWLSPDGCRPYMTKQNDATKQFGVFYMRAP